MTANRPATSQSNVNVGGSSNAPIQSVAGKHITAVQGANPRNIDDVRELLARFRRELEAHPATLRDPEGVNDALTTIESSLDDPQSQKSILRTAALALKTSIVGTAVEKVGKLLVDAIYRLFT